MGEHDGHRERIRQKFLKYGLDSFDDHQVLELLLFYSLPRKDTNVLAHKLMSSFGSLSAVLDGDIGDLMSVEGIGTNTAALIKLIPAVNSRYLQSKNKSGKYLKSSADIVDFFQSVFYGKREEYLYILCLDNSHKVISLSCLAQGSPDTVSVDARKILTAVIKSNASAVVLAHNHVGHSAVVSKADRESTAAVKRLLEEVGVTLLDHVIIADNSYCFVD